VGCPTSPAGRAPASAYYAGRAPDLDSDCAVLTLDEMVDRYVADIRAIQPEGPYSLLGYSFGAVLAFEIANRLVTKRQMVRHLVMFDRQGPSSWRSRAAKRTTLRLKRLLCRMVAMRLIPVPLMLRLSWGPLDAASNCIGPGPLTSADLQRILRVVFPQRAEQARGNELSFEDPCNIAVEEFRQALPPQEWQFFLTCATRSDAVARMKALKVYTKNRWFSEGYRPRAVFPGRITIYASSTTQVDSWQRYSSQPLDVRIVPTQPAAEKSLHRSFIDPPNAAQFAGDLRALLEND
jgi:pimeloyl-ACP methyl ester carboxylesterase